jgi:hypothetical protein
LDDTTRTLIIHCVIAGDDNRAIAKLTGNSIGTVENVRRGYNRRIAKAAEWARKVIEQKTAEEKAAADTNIPAIQWDELEERFETVEQKRENWLTRLWHKIKRLPAGTDNPTK